MLSLPKKASQSSPSCLDSYALAPNLVLDDDDGDDDDDDDYDINNNNYFRLIPLQC